MLVPRLVLEGVSKICTAIGDSSRFALHCVGLKRKPDGVCHAAATDGCALVVARWKEPKEPASESAAISELVKAKVAGHLHATDEKVEGFETLVAIDDIAEIGRACRSTARQVQATPLYGYVGIQEQTPEQVKDRGSQAVYLVSPSRRSVLDVEYVQGRFPRYEDVPIEPAQGQECETVLLSIRLLAKVVKSLETLAKGMGETDPSVFLTLPSKQQGNGPVFLKLNSHGYGHGDVQVQSVIMPLNTET